MIPANKYLKTLQISKRKEKRNKLRFNTKGNAKTCRMGDGGDEYGVPLGPDEEVVEKIL